MSESLREKQMAEAEELLGDRLAKIGFARALYFGHFLGDKLLPLFIAGLIPVRLLAGRFFSAEDLEALDAAEEPEEEETHWAA